MVTSSGRAPVHSIRCTREAQTHIITTPRVERLYSEFSDIIKPAKVWLLHECLKDSQSKVCAVLSKVIARWLYAK